MQTYNPRKASADAAIKFCEYFATFYGSHSEYPEFKAKAEMCNTVLKLLKDFDHSDTITEAYLLGLGVLGGAV